MIRPPLYDELEQAQIEIALLKSQLSLAGNKAPLYAVLDASPIPQALYNEQQDMTYLNPAFIETFGYELSEVPTLLAWCEKAYPDLQNRQKIYHDWQLYLKKPIHKQAINNTDVYCQNGSVKHVVVEMSLVKCVEKDICLMTLCDVDFAELKKTQLELEEVNIELDATLRAIPDLLFELDEDGRYINLWARNKELLAAEKQALLGYTVNEKLPQDAANVVMQALLEAADTGSSNGRVMPLSLPTGKHWFELSIAIKPNKRTKKHFIIISRDVTERINTEEQLRRSQKMDALGKLTGGIAHDFNNMLGVILGYGELLQATQEEGSKLFGYTKQIIKAGNRARSLTSKLLAFSRKQPIEMRPWMINEILHADLPMLEKTLTPSIALKINQGENLWNTCLDRNNFSDAILNMCINSMHAMPEGGALTVTTKNKIVSEEMTQTLSINAGEYVQFVIEDTGTGISAEVQEKIFEPFFTTKESKGTGLGLSQVYGFVKQSKGDIQVHSVLKKGTQFIVYLPRYIGEKDKAELHEKEDKALKVNQSKSILIVDDEPALCEMTGEFLKLNLYKVYSAEDANQALTLLSKEKIDLMLTDVIMPGMNGYQLAFKVAQQYPDVKLIIASGYNDEGGSPEVKNLSYKYLNKPYRSNVLLKLIKELLA